MSKFDSFGRPIGATNWDAISGIPVRVSEIEALTDAGADTVLGWDDTTNTLKYLSAAQVAAIIAGSTSTNLVLSMNESNVDAFRRLGSPAAGSYTITIRPGVIISSLTAATPALDLSGFASGSTINVVNLGYILGAGGAGGIGGNAGDCDGGASYIRTGSAGESGGDAVKGPGTGITFNIDNASGFIWGGGGGGGGGGATSSTTNAGAAGGGGGGGAGGGLRGTAGSHGSNAASTVSGANGTTGSTGASGTNGTGGAGANTGSATGGAGGDGGAFGAAGSAGVSPTAFTLDAAGGAAGAAGKAINLNGGTTGTFTGSGSPNIKGAVS